MRAIPNESNEKDWLTTTSPSKDMLIFMSQRENGKYQKFVKSHPTKSNKLYRDALASNAEPIKVNKSYLPTPALRKKFKLNTDTVVLHPNGSEYYEIWNKKEFDRKSDFARPKMWDEQTMILLNPKSIKKLFQID